MSQKIQSPLETRWRFVDSLSEEEQKVHDIYVKKIKAWWTTFEDKQEQILTSFKDRDSFDLIKFMEEELLSVYPYLAWEFAQAVEGEGHRLVISCEHHRYMQPFVDTIIDMAPKLDDWEFYAYRIAEDYELAEQAVMVRTGGTLNDIFFHVQISDASEIDITFIRENCESDEDFQQLFQDGFTATQVMLGEERLNTWVGRMQVLNKAHEEMEAYELKELPDIFEQTLVEIQKNLPKKPYWKQFKKFSWSVLQYEPEKAEDYLFQQDMLVGPTASVPLAQSVHSGMFFSSKRFSKVGETFCYLKVDGSKEESLGNLEDRASLEDAINDVLLKAKLGCSVGGGTGLRYSYVNLALVDLEEGIELIREVLQGANVGKRAWIQFFDSDWDNEWVGIWDDSPRPPFPEYDS